MSPSHNYRVQEEEEYPESAAGFDTLLARVRTKAYKKRSLMKIPFKISECVCLCCFFAPSVDVFDCAMTERVPSSSFPQATVLATFILKPVARGIEIGVSVYSLVAEAKKGPPKGLLLSVLFVPHTIPPLQRFSHLLKMTFFFSHGGRVVSVAGQEHQRRGGDQDAVLLRGDRPAAAAGKHEELH
jgi:hypothetical protein